MAHYGQRGFGEYAIDPHNHASLRVAAKAGFQFARAGLDEHGLRRASAAPDRPGRYRARPPAGSSRRTSTVSTTAVRNSAATSPHRCPI